MTSIQELLGTYQPDGGTEAADVARVQALIERSPDPYPRSLPLHVTGSALIVHPDSGRVLLRWHPRQQAWLQVGGHGDPAHEHADMRFFLATRTPDAIVAERPDAPLRWLTLPGALELTTETNLAETLNRAGRLLPDRA